LQRELIISTILKRRGVESLAAVAKRAAKVAGVFGGSKLFLIGVKPHLPDDWDDIFLKRVRGLWDSWMLTVLPRLHSDDEIKFQ
jgi:hypothetical protein